jgi:hypothetical protein
MTLAIPALPIAAVGMSTRRITPAEAVEQADFQRNGLYGRLPIRNSRYSRDSLRNVVRENFATWLERIQVEPAAGMQMDFSGRIAIVLGDDSSAVRHVTTRLKDPSLTVADKAYTLRSVIEAISKTDDLKRMPIAEQFMRTLDSLGPGVAEWRFKAHASLMKGYYAQGNSPDIVRHGKAAGACHSGVAITNTDSMKYT